MSFKNLYLNPKQKAFVKAVQKKKVFVGGRASGKSAVNGVESYQNLFEMPRSKGFIAHNTYKIILDFVLPEIFKIWGLIGLKENVHYVVNKKPPARWPTPYSKLSDYSTAISVINGSAIQLISLDRKDSNRGGNFDWHILDEAAFVKQKRYTKELGPSIRGNIYKFLRTLRHQLKIFTTSMPWDPTGFWVPDMAEEAALYPDKVYYTESTAADNAVVVGADYLERAEREEDYLTFQIEYLNRRIGKMPNSFYDSFDINKHCEVKYIYEDADDWRQTKVINADYKDDRPIDVSFDFGGKFNCMISAQDNILTDNEIRILKSFFVKDERKLIDNLVNDFCKYYKTHKHKVVYIYCDSKGKNQQFN
jgi:hypothetical protein